MKEHDMTTCEGAIHHFNGHATWPVAVFAAAFTLLVATATASPASSAGKIIAGWAGAEGAEQVGRRVASKVVAEAGEQAAKAAAERAAREVAEKAAVKAGGSVASETAERAAEIAAKRTAIEAARRTGGKTLAVKTVEGVTKPATMFAIGAGAAAVVGSHEVADGYQELNYAKADAVRDVAKNNPEKLPGVLWATGGGLLLGLTCIAGWFFSWKGVVLLLGLYAFCSPFRRWCRKLWTKMCGVLRKRVADTDAYQGVD